jgi:hypothetical protein
VGLRGDPVRIGEDRGDPDSAITEGEADMAVAAGKSRGYDECPQLARCSAAVQQEGGVDSLAHDRSLFFFVTARRGRKLWVARLAEP